MEKQDCFLLGTIFKLHGYKGDVNIYNDNDIPLVYTDIDFFYIEDHNELIPYFTESIRPKKKQVLLVKLEDVNSEEQALKILKRKVYIPNKFLPEIENIYPDYLFFGWVSTNSLKALSGIVNFVNDKTSQKLIVVRNGKKEFFIPFHDNFVININLKKKILEVNIPQELIEIN